jgi:DNA-binding SARP family transcriptional activator
MAERERLRELALETLAKLLAHQRATGASELAVQTALRLVALDPLLQPAHRTPMRPYAQLGAGGRASSQDNGSNILRTIRSYD